MKKALALLLLTLLTLIPLPTLAEDDAEASLRVGWFPADRYGQYAEFIPDEYAARELTVLLNEVEFHDITDFTGTWPDKDAFALVWDVPASGSSCCRAPSLPPAREVALLQVVVAQFLEV